jgi:manganese transport protein
MAAPVRLLDMLRYVGPGLILTASIVGSGELIVTPKLAGEAGFKLLWLIVLGCVIKVFVQVELGRFAVAKGMTTLEAMNSVPGPRLVVSWLVWLWFFMFVGLVFQIAGIIGGIAQVFATGGVQLSTQVLAVFIGASCPALLLLGRYRLIENLSTAMVVAFTFATVVAVAAVQWSPYHITPANLIEGFSFGLPEKFTTAFAAFGIIGVGASELIYYPYWCLEKGYAQRVGQRDGSREWLERARGWMRVMRLDAWVSMLVYTGATVAFYLLGAAVLHGKGLKVEDDQMIATLAHMYLESFGPWSFYVFLFGAFNVLYSTAFVATASNARLLADGMTLFKVVQYPTPADREKMIRRLVVVLPALSVLLYVMWQKPVALVFIGAVGQGLMLPFLGLAAVYFRHCRTEPDLQPGRAWTACLWTAAISMAVAGGYQVINEILKLR